MHANETKRRRSTPFRAACLLLAVLAGCRGGEAPDADYDQSQFGDPYEILLGYSPAAPETPPTVGGDTLRALVSYAGGCKDHDFKLRAETRADTTRLWLHHDAQGDDCEEIIQDLLLLPLPSDADAATIVLLNPHDPVPFTVGWEDSGE